MGLKEQAEEIQRYHQHLVRNYGNVSKDEACRKWIDKYARHWRERYERQQASENIT